MNYIGIDLHKKSITVCVMNDARKVVQSKRFMCAEVVRIGEFFTTLKPFTAVMEATASYEWLWQLLAPLAERLVLAHPKKLRIIAESTSKSDKVDAKVLATFLALDMIPEAYRPTPRQRQHRALVRQQMYIRDRVKSLKNKIRHVLSNYNADRPDLFGSEGWRYLMEVQAKVSPADRFVLKQLMADLEFHWQQRTEIDKELKRFGKAAPAAEKEARELLATAPAVGPVTIDVVVSELGDIGRFRSQRQVVAYAGLAPGYRESDGRTKELRITKNGSGLLRWALVEAAWRLVRRSARWRSVFEGIKKRRGKKKAIVAVARRLLTVMASMLRSGQPYRFAV